MPPKTTQRRRQPVRGAQLATAENEMTQAELTEPPLEEHLPADDAAYPEILTHADGPQSSNPLSEATMSPQEEMILEPSSTVAAPPRPSRPPRERLASVLPHSSLAGQLNPLKFQPKSAVRRDKTERDAMEKAEAERQVARQAGFTSNMPTRGGTTGRGRGNYDGRSPFRRERYQVSHQASGVLGGGLVKESVPSKRRLTRGGAGRALSKDVSAARDASVEETGSNRTTKPKTSARTSSAVKPETDKDADGDVDIRISRSKRSATTAKKKVRKEEEEAQYLSDEAEWDDDHAPRVNIEQINLLSEDEDDSQPERSDISKGKQKERAPRPSAWQLRPVRLQRQEHVERQVGVNTNASSLTSAELRRRAKERQDADGPLFIPEEDAAEVVANMGRKTKRGRDVEFLKGNRKWKGVWQGEEDDDVKVKEEPKDGKIGLGVSDRAVGEELGRNAVELGSQQVDTELNAPIAGDGGDLIDANDAEMQVDDPENALQPAQRRLKIKGYRDMRSILIADDEESEGHEDTEFTEIIQLWKGFHESDTDDTTDPAIERSTTAALGDQDPASSGLKGNPYREEKSFLIQLPPIIPSLRDICKPAPKPKAEDKKRPKPQVPEPPTNPFSNPIKPDPDIKDDPAADLKEPTIPNAYTVSTLHPPAGLIGTLTMYDSGRIIADWGGTTLEVSKEGRPSSLAQEVLLTEYENTMTKIEDTDRWEEVIKVGGEGREAWAVGKIEEGFVAGLDWDALLG